MGGGGRGIELVNFFTKNPNLKKKKKLGGGGAGVSDFFYYEPKFKISFVFFRGVGGKSK